MNRLLLHVALLAPLLVVVCGLDVASTLAQTQDCAACHQALVKVANLHAAAEDCATCHEATGTSHPQKGQKTFKLVEQVPALCLTCHDAFTKPVLHEPVKEGSCTTCHDPHGSDHAKLLVASPKELCATCHSDKAEFKYPHGPVSAGDCLACHVPHESDQKALLKTQGDALCVGCHLAAQSFSKAKVVHAALEGGCTTCHNPHGAERPKLLTEQGSQLCFQCHDELQAKVEKAKVAHPPVTSDKGCVTCHSPHASENAKLLLKSESETCLGCHKTIVPKSATLLHGPVKDGQCTACHDPHGSQYAKLLVAEFAKDPYVAYDGKEFALCFTCHDRALVRDAQTSTATDFRDGDKNLHFLHVNKQGKGRSCTLCHEVHASAGPALVAKDVAFGQWRLPLNFVKTGTGGSCAPGCHRSYSYDRKNPGRKLELPAPAKKRD